MIPADLVCEGFEPAKWLLYSPDIPPVIHWAHFTSLFFALALGIFILHHNSRGLANRILFVMLMVFAVYVFSDSVIWATNRAAVVLTGWTIEVLLETLVYLGGLYLLYVLVDKRDSLSFNSKLLLALLYAPIALLSPTSLTLSGFDIASCNAIEGPFIYYVYGLEIAIVFWIIVFAARRYMATTDFLRKNEILLLTAGVLLFLASFSWGNIVASFTEDWVISNYGYFGVSIFSGFLIYSIARFKTFDIKLLLSVVLVLTLLLLLFVGMFV